MRRRWVFLVPVVLVGMTVFILIGGTVVQALWNWLLPELFGFRRISFWQALGLLLLCRILFGGFGMQGSSRRRHSPEERERFRQAMRARWRSRWRDGEQPAGADAPSSAPGPHMQPD